MRDIKDILKKGVSYETPLNEDKLINNDDELKDYAEKLLKKAHGDKFDSKVARKTVSDLMKKYKDKDGKTDYDTIIGVLQNSLDESIEKLTIIDKRINESLIKHFKKSINENFKILENSNFDLEKSTASFSVFIDLCELAEPIVELTKFWNQYNQETVISKEITTKMNHIEKTINKVYSLHMRIPNITSMMDSVGIDITAEEVTGKKLATVIRQTEEWKDLMKYIDKLDDALHFPSSYYEIRTMMIVFINYFEQIREILKA